MAQLKDSIVSGNLRVTDTTLTDTLHVTTIKAPTSSGGTTYGPGTNGQILKSNGTMTYWADMPTIPTVNNASLALKGAGTTVTTFTANSSTNQSLDIVAGTNVTITPDATNHKITIASSYTNTDTKVNVTLATTSKAYLLGTTTTPTGTAAGVTSVADTGVYLTTTAGELCATKFMTSGKNGYYTHDSDNAKYPLVYENATNLWVGAEGSTSYPHKGETFISAGWLGTLPTTPGETLTGNSTIKISVPKYTAGSNGGTWNHSSYSILHTGNTSVTTSGSGNAITSLSFSNGTFTATKGSTFSLSNHTHSNYLGAVKIGSYYGMADPDGTDTHWIRTSTLGIIPATSVSLANGGDGSLGTSVWAFKDAYVANINGVAVGSSPKFTDANVLQSNTETTDYRPILFGKTQTTTIADLSATVTGQAYVSSKMFAKPDTGKLYASEFITSGYINGAGSDLTQYGLYLRSYKTESLPAGGDYDYSRYAVRTYGGKSGENSGMLLEMGGGGLTIVGAGESASFLAALISDDQRDSNTSRTRLDVGGTLNTSLNGSSEQLILSSDNNIYFLTACNTIANRKPVCLDTSSYFYPGTNKTGSIGTSSYMWNSVYATTIYENGASLASKYAAIGHTHSNYLGAVKIGSYYGMAWPDGTDKGNNSWIRTTRLGIIPYAKNDDTTDGNVSSLGTSIWTFAAGYINDLYYKDLKTVTVVAGNTADNAIDKMAGSFFFSGTGLFGGVNDWVGIQAGYANDKFQLAANGTSGVLYRHNDTGGTDTTSWTAIKNLMTPEAVSGQNGITVTKRTNTLGTGSTALTYDSGVTIGHSNSVTAVTSAVFKKITYDAQGHITGTANVTASDLPSHTHNYAGSSSAGGAATSANKLNTNAGATNRPVYFSGGVPVQCDTPESTSWFKGVPLIKTDGVMEIGKIIDFHATNTSEADYDYRMETSTTAMSLITRTSSNTLTIRSAGNTQLSFQTTSSGKAYTASGISCYPLTTTGMTALFNFGGNLVIGGGEAAQTLYDNNYDTIKTAEHETLYLASDSEEIHLITGVNTYAERKVLKILEGQLTKSGGTWIAARDNAPVHSYKGGDGTSGSFYPAIFSKSKNGGWAIGTLGNADTLYASYTTDANYSSNTNASTYTIQFPKAGGTLALTADLDSYLPLSGGTMTGAIAYNNATTRLNNLKNLTNDNVGTSATYFLTITNSWGKGGYTSVANAKTVLGMGTLASRSYVEITSITTVTANKKYTCTANTNTYKTFMVIFSYGSTYMTQWFTITGSTTAYYPIFASMSTEAEAVLSVQCSVGAAATITFQFSNGANSPVVEKVIGFNFGG